ncbi:MAG: ACT domain-containing protein [Desulfobacterales bacterium]|nr:ACT domain-containing protein [Desulfobacterales bacterium]
MKTRTLSLEILPERMAVCRFDSASELPDWIGKSVFYSITRTEEELTLVCREATAPSDTKCERGWRCFRVQGVLDFSEIGIMFSITQPLAKSGVSVFAISTYDTDYFLVKENDLANAVDALTAAGHQVLAEDPSSLSKAAPRRAGDSGNG